MLYLWLPNLTSTFQLLLLLPFVVLCKGALPPKYSVQLVAQPQASRYTNNQSKASDNRKLNEPTSRKKISEVGVVVGGVMGGDSLQEQGKCTGKNIDCILTLLHLINQHGNVLESSWHLILTTLQVSTLFFIYYYYYYYLFSILGWHWEFRK